MKIEFYGATKQVTGSLFLLTVANSKKIIIDCGLYQGFRIAEKENFVPFGFDPKRIDLVVLTHAHLDHVGRVPKLVKEGFNGKIIATAATLDFAYLVLKDAQELMAEELERNGRELLYSMEDVHKAAKQFSPLNYGETFTIGDVKIKLYDAGHILGSAIVEIFDGKKTAVFSGDLGNGGTPILNPTQVPPAADIVIMESTYGGRVHEPIGERQTILRQIITDTIKNRGVLMIPSFAIERTQELLYEIDQLENENRIPSLPIFLDSPLAIDATSVFERHSGLWNKKTQLMKASGDNFFHFPGLRRCVTVEQSKEINATPSPKIIIAGAGMMNGGRILHHLIRYLPQSNSTVLIVGYQAQGTLGRQLLNIQKGILGKNGKRVKIHDSWVQVNAQIKPIGAYSAHADQPQLINWLTKIQKPPGKVCLVHGEEDQMLILAAAINKDLNFHAVSPSIGDTIEV